MTVVHMYNEYPLKLADGPVLVYKIDRGSVPYALITIIIPTRAVVSILCDKYRVLIVKLLFCNIMINTWLHKYKMDESIYCR